MTNKTNETEKSTPLYGIVDERTKAIVYQGDAYTGRFMLFAVLIDVVLRSMNFKNDFFESNWDLMSIVIVGGFISTVFQMKSKIIFNKPYGKSFFFIFAFMSITALIAMLVTILL